MAALSDQVPGGGAVMTAAVRSGDELSAGSTAPYAPGTTYLDGGVSLPRASFGGTTTTVSPSTTNMTFNAAASSSDGNETTATRTTGMRRRQNPLVSEYRATGGGDATGSDGLQGLLDTGAAPATPADAGTTTDTTSGGPNVVLILLVLAAAGVAVWWFFFRKKGQQK